METDRGRNEAREMERSSLRRSGRFSSIPQAKASDSDLPNDVHVASRLLGTSPRLNDLQDQIRRVAARSCTVLIHGESGTGKELTARQIHASSSRASGPFVPVDCATLRDSLFESQVFGHVKGAFTGAGRATIGFFRAADGGTLFLDEVGELSIGLQAKLLRCIQESAVVPLGDFRPIPVDVRIVVATHRDLQDMVRQGAFRGDLYYRLAVVCLETPSLRSRPQDILPLAEHYLTALADFYEEEPKVLSAEAKKSLETYNWPGNVRELINAVERGFVLTTGREIGVEALPSSVRQPDASALCRSDSLTLESAQRRAIITALESVDEIKSQAAVMLGIDSRRLKRLMRRLNIQ